MIREREEYYCVPMLIYQALSIASHASPKGSGVPIGAIFGTVGSMVGIIAFAMQLHTNHRRKRYERAETKLLDAIDSSDVIKQATLEVKQYEDLKSSLRNEIETQIPRQARIAYLTDRLDQLSEDLHTVYRAYEDARRELSEVQPVSELDQRIRETVELSIIPATKLRDRRNIYLASLVVALILFNINPFRLNEYFYTLGYSDNSSPDSIILAMALGAVCLTLLVLIVRTFHHKTIAPGKRGIKFLLGVLGLSVVLIPVLLWGGFYFRSEAIFTSQFAYSDITGQLTEASLLFNAVVILVSVEVAAFVRFMQARGARLRSKPAVSDRLAN
jgi:hypothetical protein